MTAVFYVSSAFLARDVITVIVGYPSRNSLNTFLWEMCLAVALLFAPMSLHSSSSSTQCHDYMKSKKECMLTNFQPCNYCHIIIITIIELDVDVSKIGSQTFCHSTEAIFKDVSIRGSSVTNKWHRCVSLALCPPVPLSRQQSTTQRHKEVFMCEIPLSKVGENVLVHVS